MRELDPLVTPEESTEIADTTAGKFLGTLQYCSPEQLGGGVVDGRTDIFSLGVVMYEMLTAMSSFRRELRVSLRGDLVASQEVRHGCFSLAVGCCVSSSAVAVDCRGGEAV